MSELLSVVLKTVIEWFSEGNFPQRDVEMNSKELNLFDATFKFNTSSPVIQL